MADWDAFADKLPDSLRRYHFALGSIVRNLGIDEQHLLERLGKAEEQDQLLTLLEQVSLARNRHATIRL